MVLQRMDFIMKRKQEKKQSHAPRMERKCNNPDILVNKKKGSERGSKQDLSNGSRNCGDSVAMVWGRDHRDLVGK